MNTGYIFQRTHSPVHCRSFFNKWPVFYSIHTSKNLLWTDLLTSLLILTSSFTAAITLWHYFCALQHIIKFIFKIDWRGEDILWLGHWEALSDKSEIGLSTRNLVLGFYFLVPHSFSWKSELLAYHVPSSSSHVLLCNLLQIYCCLCTEKGYFSIRVA